MITIRQETFTRHCRRAKRCSIWPSARPLQQDGRAPARGPAAGRRPVVRRDRERPRRRHRAAVERHAPGRRGRRCCSARSRSPATRQDRGIGARADAAHVAARRRERLGHSAVLLVGDAPYYGRFGFSAEKTGALWLPGRYERHRLLALRTRSPARSTARAGSSAPTGRLRAEAGSRRPRRRACPQTTVRSRRARPEPSCLCWSNRYERTDPHDREPRPARPVRRPDRDDRLRLDRPRRAAAARAPHRLRPLEVRRHRSGRYRSRAARRAQAALREGRDHPRELPRRCSPRCSPAGPAAA